METVKGDLKINGYGTLNGGSFRYVHVNGKGTVNGHIECEEFECNGAGTFNGNVTSKKAKINGNANIDGKVNVTDLRIDGSAGIKEDTVVEEMKIYGKASIGGNVKGGQLHIRGKATIKGSCEVDEFKADGNFSVGELLSADQIEVTLYGECRAKEIGGQSISVKQKMGSILRMIQSIIPSRLYADVIEGDDIYLECTTAKLVRGNNVTIGPDCVIDVVEYTGSYSEEKDTTVKQSKKA